jgi:hypothetical protein
MHDEEGAEPNYFDRKELKLPKVSQGQPHLIGHSKGVRIKQNGGGTRLQKTQSWNLPRS